MQDVLQTQLNLEIVSWDIYEQESPSNYHFEGSITEIFAQMAHKSNIGTGPFKLLLEAGAEFFDPSIILFSYVGSHQHEYCKDHCHLAHLLQLGANANISGHMFMPLQIAVLRLDFEGVKLLLEAGANPNSTGNSEGHISTRDYLYDSFADHHGLSPLQICRKRKYLVGAGRFEDIESIPAKVEQVLLRYGAKV